MGDHAANGEAKKAVKEVKRQVRASCSKLGRTGSTTFLADHRILTWQPRIGEDGKTAEQWRAGMRSSPKSRALDSYLG